MGALNPAILVGLDWGTTSLRAYLLDAQGQALASRQMHSGIMNLPGDDTETLPRRFERAFDDACGDWLRNSPRLPVIACGMVGSAQGWKEARYIDLPCSLNALAGALTKVERGHGTVVHIVPGLMQGGLLPNVMRGEETQVAGILDPSANAEPVLIGLPGSHSKWVLGRGDTVQRFETFMSGEIYAALCTHTLLGRTMRHDGQRHDDAFLRGLKVAASDETGRLGILSNAFSCRTLGLTGALAANEQADYLSGLVIGHELVALRTLEWSFARRIVLCGEVGLCARYALALDYLGFPRAQLAPESTLRGLTRIARSAGLIEELRQ